MGYDSQAHNIFAIARNGVLPKVADGVAYVADTT